MTIQDRRLAGPFSVSANDLQINHNADIAACRVNNAHSIAEIDAPGSLATRA
jgi:hypothetical protein